MLIASTRNRRARPTSIAAILTVALITLQLGCYPSAPVGAGKPGRLALRNPPRVAERSGNGPSSPSSLNPAESHQRMVDRLAGIADSVDQDNIWIGNGRTLQLREALAGLPNDVDDINKVRLTYFLGRSESDLGNEQQAIKHFQAARQMLEHVGHLMDPSEVQEITFRLGLAHLRYGETQNCCRRNAPESCILPIQGEGIHTHQEASRQAIEHFNEVLRLTSGEHLRARWLLNIAYMTLGEYPQGVPEVYLVPPQVFASDEAFPRFTNIAAELGLNAFNLVGSVVIEDFDSDGFLDVLTSTWDPTGQMHYYRNLGDGTFVDQTQEAGLSGLLGGINMVQADYDNDGDVDVLVLRGAWLFDVGRHPNSLLQNNGDGTFVDVTYLAGLGDSDYPSHVAGWSDYDLDGDLDVYIGNEMPSGEKQAAAGQLFENLGDGTFRNVAAKAGVENRLFAKGVVWGDFDGDRYPDLYVSNMQAPNRLYRNNGDGTFTDVAPTLGVDRPIDSFPAWFWDFDNDGTLDLYVSSYRGDKEGLSVVSASYLGMPHDVELNRLYRGDGQGGFEEVAEELGLNRLASAMGANFGDLDNDGYLDFYLGTGFPEYEALMPNVMYRNQAGQGFADITTSGGFGHLQKGHGVAFADLDNDGDQDVFEQLGGNFRGDKYYDALFENPGFDNHWITIRLVGVESNRSAIGTRIHAVINEDGERRSVYKHVNSGGSFGANPLQQTLGLGRAAVIERLEIFWPTTGKTQTFVDLPVDRAIEITEGESAIKDLELSRITLGGE